MHQMRLVVASSTFDSDIGHRVARPLRLFARSYAGPSTPLETRGVSLTFMAPENASDVDYSHKVLASITSDYPPEAWHVSSVAERRRCLQLHVQR